MSVINREYTFLNEERTHRVSWPEIQAIYRFKEIAEEYHINSYSVIFNHMPINADMKLRPIGHMVDMNKMSVDGTKVEIIATIKLRTGMLSISENLKNPGENK